MNVIYQITAKGERAYASNVAACDALCLKMYAAGKEPHVKRMKRSQVPLEDIELINEL